jgi:hypothetical protein
MRQLGRKISLDTVALSRSHLFKLFKDCVGTSPLHVVDWSRMEAAVRMLGETDKPIADDVKSFANSMLHAPQRWMKSAGCPLPPLRHSERQDAPDIKFKVR